MAQRILFSALPNTLPLAYVQTLTLIFGEVSRSSPSMKDLRDFMKLRNVFDKETWPLLTAMLELREEGGTVSMGRFGRDLLAAEDEATGREVIARHLIAQNPLIAKYCLEALDTEHGGRLHSTNEFYRMLTSFVYPGEKPTLVSFKAWVEWAVGCNLLKLVGVRWAIGEVGLKELPRMRMLDSEEFLEEEREAASQAPADEPPPAEPEIVSESVSSTGPSPAVALAAPAKDAPPVSATAPAPKAPKAAPPPSHPVDRMVAPVAVKAEDLDVTRDLLVAWHAGYPGRIETSARRVGLDPSRKSPMLAFEMSFAAMLLGRGIEPATVQALFEAMRGPGLLLNMGKGKFPGDGLASVMARSSEPGFVSACEAAIHLPRLFKVATDTSTPLATGDDPRAVLWGLYRRLYEPMAPLAPFFLARFLWEAGMLPEPLATAAFVPTYAVRENAFRIGFVDRLHCSSFGDLIDVALHLAERFGAPVFEGPLAQVNEAYGCTFHCGRTASCALFCREKGDIARRGPA